MTMHTMQIMRTMFVVTIVLTTGRLALAQENSEIDLPWAVTCSKARRPGKPERPGPL